MLLRMTFLHLVTRSSSSSSSSSSFTPIVHRFNRSMASSSSCPGWLQSPRCLIPATGQLQPFPQAVSGLVKDKRLVFLGENHAQAEVVQFELAVAKILAAADSEGIVNLIMEHFNLAQQSLLDRFMRDEESTVDDLVRAYNEQGDEGHDIAKYQSLLDFAKSSPRVKLWAGFVPRSLAKVLVKESEATALRAAEERGYLDPADFVPGSDDHYNFFDSLISGRDLADSSLEASDRFRRIFPAQVFKDSVMASVIARHVRESSCAEDKFLVICGNGHCDYRFGVPERVDRLNVVDAKDTCLLSVRPANNFDLNNADELRQFQKVDAFSHAYPADVLFFYEDVEEQVKEEIAQAYDKVASTAHKEGNLRKAEQVLRRLGYTDEQIRVAGQDGYNYQGVGNPHKLADIRPGQKVLDLGSGLGVDSFIAAEAVGDSGQVTGLDISKGEVLHASKRAEARGARNVRFVHGDMERMPLESDSLDRVISNGAFCLAPNKEKAFREIHRVLRPGGRFSVACSTLLQTLDEGVNWPICMRVFMPLADAEPMLKRLGFVDVEVDMSDSKMRSDEEGEDKNSQVAEEEDLKKESGRVGVHVGSEEFKHLDEFDMNTLCARVILTGVKKD